VADVEILAEIALQITVGKENGSRTILADKRGFFTEMGVITVNECLIGCPADAFLAGFTVDTALSGTQRARLQDLCRLLHFFTKKTLLQGLNENGTIGVHRDLSSDAQRQHPSP
jgi:hypothetical protein